MGNRIVGALAITATAIVASSALAPEAAAAKTPPTWATAPGFAVTVSLSPRAAAKLSGLGETIIVSADFYGDADAKSQRMADDMGQIALAASQRVELPGAGAARIAGPRYDAGKLAHVEGGKMQVLINVFSGRRKNPDNLLDCSIFQDSVALAAQSGIQIQCKLIGE